MSENLKPLYSQNGNQDMMSPLSFPNSSIGGFDFWKILHAAKRWIWVIITIVVVGLILAAYAINRITPTYTATTILEVKQSEKNILEVSEVESIVADAEFLRTQMELLRSDTLLTDVVNSLNLVNDSFFMGGPESYAGLNRQRKVRRAVNSFQRQLDVNAVGRSRLIRVTVEHSDPRMAARIANTTAETFINNSLARKFNASQYARDFVQERLLTARQSLEKAERELVKYSSDPTLITTTDSSDSNQSLNRIALLSIDAELTQAYTERLEAESALKRWNEGDASSQVLGSSVVSRLKQTRSELQDEYLRKRSVFKPSFPDMVELQNRIDEISTQIAYEETEIVSSQRAKLEREFALAKDKEDSLQQRVRELKSQVVDTNVKSINLNILQRQVDSERSQYEALLQRLKELTVAGEVGESLVQIVDEAYAAQFPSNPKRARLFFFALLTSLAAALGLALIVETIDDRIKSPDDLRTKLGLEVLGIIPMVAGEKDKILADIKDPYSALAESYSSLRTNLQFLPGGAPQIIQITSTRPSEGKSTTSLGIATSFASLGENILLIDCDIRSPTFSRGSVKSKGLSGLILSDEPASTHIIQSNFDNLHILPAGISDQSAQELLSRGRFRTLIEELRKQYAVIIIDSPPVLGLADAPIIGTIVDGTIFVAQSGLLRIPVIQSSINRLKGSGTNIIGGLITKFNTEEDGYYSYKYYGSYGKQESENPFEANTKRAKSGKQKSKINIVD